jgi:predicted AAA+ superfamily ATPase
MCEIVRDVEKSLLEWKLNYNKKALLIEGARQIGKTHIIRRFIKDNYKNIIEINFYKNEKAKQMFNNAESVDEIKTRISIYSKKPINADTVIFFDEVQECKEIVTAIKFLVEDNDCDFILSGSLLGVELKSIKSVPVGYMHTIRMYPVTFKEYSRCFGIHDEIWSSIEKSFNNISKVDDFIHERLISLFYEYLIVGGMPEAVSNFIESRDVALVREIQKDIINLNKHDISQYASNDEFYLKKIYDLIPQELNSQNKRFKISSIQKDIRFNRMENKFLWLVDAGVALASYNVNEPIYPLLLSANHNLFRLFLGDVGLLTSTFSKSVSEEILSKNIYINYGSIFENFVALELATRDYKLYYYTSKKIGEIDFVIESPGGEVSLIEVKSGKYYKSHAALNNIKKIKNYKFDKSIVISENNFSYEHDTFYIPVYALGFL